jgi:cyanophycinase
MHTPGALALVGSGEYTAAMETTDQHLLATLGGPAHARVALIPTASALEEGQPQRWNAMGAVHFTRLGAQQTAPLALLTPADADDAELLRALEQQNFFYFSGGNPAYLVATFDGTRAWATIRSRWLAGAVVAGCSAGAMMLGAALPNLRELRGGGPPRWERGLELVSGIAVLPHFDRLRLWLGEARLAELIAAAPPAITVVGIDEDTALVSVPQASPNTGLWQVSGRQSVTVFRGSGPAEVVGSGEELSLS